MRFVLVLVIIIHIRIYLYCFFFVLFLLFFLVCVFLVLLLLFLLQPHRFPRKKKKQNWLVLIGLLLKHSPAVCAKQCSRLGKMRWRDRHSRSRKGMATFDKVKWGGVHNGPSQFPDGPKHLIYIYIYLCVCVRISIIRVTSCHITTPFRLQL